MCGIVGIWNQVDRETVAKMARSVSHRGPDGLDCIVIGNNSFGASRLSIKGDPHASAIFHDIENDVVVMLNGEIYNIESVRSILVSQGCIFQTDLETEVLCQLYKRDGVDFVRKLQGMFAIAIMDNDRLVLVRDRFGIKPLYYAHSSGRVLFSSEIKAILTHPEFTTELYLPALEELFVFGYVYSLDKTLFEGIYQVEPGTVKVFKKEKQESKRYWQVPEACFLNREIHLDYQSAIRQLRTHIIKNIDNILSHGDHLVGIYLSGGIDSTILTLVARYILDYPVTTFTLSDSSDTADFLAAREVASKLGTKHVERKVSVEDYFNTIDHFVKYYEMIVAGGVFDIHGGVAFHLLSETVSNYVKVAISGEGADELFGGYYWIYTHTLGFSDRIRDRLNQLNSGNSDIHQIVNSLFPLPEDEQVYRRNVLSALINGGLANYHLQSVDRSAGAYGFEIRPAYLHDNISDFALKLPIEYKVPDKQSTKRILKDAFRPELEKLGLDWVPNRLKEGMPAAISGLIPAINQRIEDSIDDSEIMHHPLRDYLKSKSDIYFFDIFAKTFLPESIYAIQDCITQ